MVAAHRLSYTQYLAGFADNPIGHVGLGERQHVLFDERSVVWSEAKEGKYWVALDSEFFVVGCVAVILAGERTQDFWGRRSADPMAPRQGLPAMPVLHGGEVQVHSAGAKLK